MRVVLYDKVYECGFRETGIWRGSVFGTKSSFRDYAVGWMNSVSWGTGHYSPYRQAPTISGVCLFYLPRDTGPRHDEVSNRHGVRVTGKYVEFRVMWLEEL